MDIEFARNGEIELAFERFGPSNGMPLILLAGAGVQMVMWPEDFCAGLVERGFQVVRMDNRDTGLSTHLTQYDVPKRQRPPRYTLRDITGDVLAVLDALGWERAHVAGSSQGGVFAQATATHHPDRVLSLTTMGAGPSMSPLIVRPKIVALVKMFLTSARKTTGRESEGQKWLDVAKTFSSPAYPVDVEHWREMGRTMYDRGMYPAGELRLAATMFAAGDRRRELAGVRCPTLVIHGAADPISALRAGRATADAIPGARFVSYPGMGHDMPRELQPIISDEIARLARAAEVKT